MKCLGRLYVCKLNKVPKSRFEEIATCNLRERGEMEDILREPDGRIKRGVTVGYVIHNNKVISVGVLFKFSHMFMPEFQVYTKKNYRNCGVATRIFKRMVRSRNTGVCLTSNKTTYFYKRLGIEEAQDCSVRRPPPSYVKRIKKRAAERHGLTL